MEAVWPLENAIVSWNLYSNISCSVWEGKYNNGPNIMKKLCKEFSNTDGQS